MLKLKINFCPKDVVKYSDLLPYKITSKRNGVAVREKVSLTEMDSGSYQLKIKIKKDVSIKIGALGICDFPKGGYVYTGSGMKNLSKRIERHERKQKTLRWHIDYLLADANVELLEAISYPAKIREECQRNQSLLDTGAEAIVKGFGSSDCKTCPSHLLRIVS